MSHWFLSRHWGAGSQPGKRIACVIFCTGHGNGNKFFSLTDFCGSFVLLFLLVVRLNLSIWEMRRDACIFIQDTDGHLLLCLSLRCAMEIEKKCRRCYHRISGP